MAERVSQFFYDYVKDEKLWESPAKLLLKVKEIGEKLREADKFNYVVPNTVKRVLHVIREAAEELKIDLNVDPSEDEGKFVNHDLKL